MAARSSSAPTTPGSATPSPRRAPRPAPRWCEPARTASPIAYAVCGDWHRADDLLQTALVKLYVAWPRLHRDGREEAYTRQIIVRANIDEHRRPWRREQSGLDGHDPVARTGLPVEDRSALFDALQALPVMQRKVVVLRHWLGLSVEETAHELGISTGTVKSHSSRGIEKLQAVLTLS